MSEELTAADCRQRLSAINQQIRSIIEQGKLQIGTLLTTVRDRKLYRHDFDTFEDYVWETWGKKRTWAYQLIDGSAVVKSLSQNVRHGEQSKPLPTKERQTRELAKAPPERQAEVWETARAGRDPEKVTAKELAEARQAAGIPPPQKIKATTEEAQEIYQLRVMQEWASKFSGDATEISLSITRYINTYYSSVGETSNGHPLWKPLIHRFLDEYERKCGSRPTCDKTDFARLKALFKIHADKKLEWWGKAIAKFLADGEEWVAGHGHPLRCFADHFTRFDPDILTPEERRWKERGEDVESDRVH